MTREEAKELAKVMLAWADGATVQYQRENTGKWVDVFNNDPTWAADVNTYRIKPEPELRPWTRDEVPVGEVVRHKDSGNRYVIESARHNGAKVDCAVWLYKNLLERFTMDKDGSPCGVTE